MSSRSGSDNLASAPRNWGTGMDSPIYLQLGQTVPYRPVDPRRGARDPPFEIVRTVPYGSFPVQSNSLLQFRVVENDRMDPRLRQLFHSSPPRNMESRLTHEDQKKALKMLKKQVYRNIPKRWCLYYRDMDSKSFDERDEDGKSCAICLDDFVPYQEVMVTPCNHMFHEDCIVPWLTGNSRCPICRFALRDNTAN
ncbi:hypothetical protein HHK36_003623 [Tetracentron sinense]|uniref:RING-type domain-containing protein n=1 Tax=Tetracentron sinense TaxID=13715 RepID=A0A834ZP17_TETSI|nr:hypothetical protein HHK36_003623 [Tetracentron sinense]